MEKDKSLDQFNFQKGSQKMLKYSFALIIAMLILVVPVYAHVGDEVNTGPETPIHKHVVASTIPDAALPFHVRDMSDGIVDADGFKQHGHNNTWHHHHSQDAYDATDPQHNRAAAVGRQGPRIVEVVVDKLVISSLTVDTPVGKKKIVFVITAKTDNMVFNTLSITVNGYKFSAISSFFGADTWDAGTFVTVRLIAVGDGYRIGRSKFTENGIRKKNGNTDPRPRGQDGEVAITTFDINNFSITLNYHNGSDTVTQADFPADGGNRIGVAAGAPSIPKPKLTTTWGALKRSKQ